MRCFLFYIVFGVVLVVLVYVVEFDEIFVDLVFEDCVCDILNGLCCVVC